MGVTVSSAICKILLIEDNKETQLLIKVILREFYTIDIVSDYDNSIKSLIENEYGLVILDINLMGNKEGIKILEYLKANQKLMKLPVIIITAYEFSDDEKQYLFENSDLYISKPFDRDLLLKSVNKMCLNI